MPISEQLVGKTAAERHVIKANAYVALGLPPTVTRSGWTLQFMRAVTRRSGGLVAVWVRVRDPDGNRVPIRNPIVIYNPPILVPDGAGGYTEDVQAALIRTVIHVVKAACRRTMPET